MAKSSKQSVEQNSSESLGIPVVAVLGHVDHGKTSLLDAIRKTNVTAREHGGITQKTGASEVEIIHEGKKRTITFIDTPGHEAFSKMRSRGASASNIGLLIVASTEGVKPQTKESIQHLLSSEQPIIVVLTKSDLPTKNPEKAIGELAKEGITAEDIGGDIPVIEVSAKTGEHIKELLELIVLVHDLKVAPEKKADPIFTAIVIESNQDTKRGPVATVVIKNGILKIKDELVCGSTTAKVKALINDKGKQVSFAIAGQGIEILGFADIPKVGELVYKKDQTIVAKKLDSYLPTQKPNQSLYFVQRQTSDLSLILCTDTQGSLEAITQSLPKEITFVLKKTGEITEADVLLAKSTNAIIVGFNTKIRNEVQRLATLEKVLLKNYTIIYELIDEIQDVLEGKQIAKQEQIFGKAAVLASFPFEQTKVLGIRVLEGRIAKGDKIRLLRDEKLVGESTVTSVRTGKEQVSKVEQGKECGIIITPILDFTIGDMLLSHD